MKRNVFVHFCALISALTIGLTACSSQGERGETGPQGEPGSQGIQGEPGKDGSRIFTGDGEPKSDLGQMGDIYVDSVTGDLYAKSETGWIKTGCIKGETGDRGENGVSIVSVSKSSSFGNLDVYTIAYSDGTTSMFTVTNGEDGPQGAQGIKGEDGHTPIITIGANGKWYVDGQDTGVSAIGIKGDKGEQGPKGDKGEDGIQGEKGEKGENGKDGVSIVSVTKSSSVGNVDFYTISYSDGSSSVFTVTNGENGETGAQGIPGKDGHTPVLNIGENGDWYVDGVDTGISARGEKGDQGPQGEKGDAGEQGPQGEKGDKGEDGVSVVNSYIDENGDLICELSNGQKINAGHVKNVGRHTVTFHVGEEVVSTIKVEDGSKISRPSSKLTAGYTIHSWKLDDWDGKDREWIFKEDSYLAYKVEDDLDLYADYDCNTYTVSFQGVGTLPDQTVTFNQWYSWPDVTKEGYRVTQWETSGGTLFDANHDLYRIAADSVFYAVWSANTHKVTLDLDGGACEQTELLLTYDDSYELPIPTRTGFRFVGWQLDGEAFGSSGLEWKIDRDITLKATWSDNPNVHYLDIGDGTLPEGTPSNVELTKGAQYALPTPMANDSSLSFSHWLFNGRQIAQEGTWAKDGQGSLTAVYVSTGLDYEIKSNGIAILGSKYKEAIRISIPSEINGVPVASIENEAFYQFDSLKKVDIPSSILSIGDSAFSCCKSLKSLYIPSSVTSLGDEAFFACWSLKNATILSPISSLGKRIFYNCTSLEEITLPKTISTIGEEAFYCCYSLDSITIPSSLSEIQDRAFGYCRALKTIYLPSSVTSIGVCAFLECSSLLIFCENSSKPDGWHLTWNGHFKNRPVFWGNSYTYGGLSPEGIAYALTSSGDAVVGGYFGSSSTLKIPESIDGHRVVALSENAFNGCDDIKNVILPSSVITIGDLAFCDCTLLSSINIPRSVSSIGQYAFWNCESLTQVSVPNSVITMGFRAFGGDQLTVYCEVPSAPEGWHMWWYNFCSVVWNCTL